MIVLQRTTQKLEAVLAGAISANQPEVTTTFFDHIPQETTTLQRRAHKVSTLNNTTDVEIVAPPGLHGIIRNVETVHVHNKDTATTTVTVKIDDGGTETILVKQSIAAGESLVYEHSTGWQILSPITPPFSDSTELVEGSSDATKRLRLEVDGFTAGTTRVWTVADADMKPAGHATGLTANRIPYATGATGGLLTDSASLTFDGTTLSANALSVSAGSTFAAITTGNATVAGTLSVSAAATMAAVSTQNLAVGGTLSVSAKAVTNALAVGGILSVASGVVVGNSGIINSGSLSNTGNMTVGGTLSVSAGAVMAAVTSQNLTVAGTLSVSAQAVVNAIRVNSTLSVSAAAAMAAVTTQNLTVAGTMSVSAAAVVNAIRVNSTLSVSAASVVAAITTQNATVAGTLSVSAGSVVQALRVGGILSTSAAAVMAAVTTQNLTVAGTLSVSSGAAVNALQVSGALSVSAAASYGITKFLVDSDSASASAALSLSPMGSAYEAYEIEVVNLIPATDTTELRIRLGTGAGPAYQSGAGDYAYWLRGGKSDGGTDDRSSGGNSEIPLSLDAANYGMDADAPSPGWSGSIKIYRPYNTTVRKHVRIEGSYQPSADAIVYVNGAAVYVTAATAITGVQFLMASGNIASGSVYLYGLKT